MQGEIDSMFIVHVLSEFWDLSVYSDRGGKEGVTVFVQYAYCTSYYNLCSYSTDRE